MKKLSSHEERRGIFGIKGQRMGCGDVRCDGFVSFASVFLRFRCSALSESAWGMDPTMCDDSSI